MGLHHFRMRNSYINLFQNVRETESTRSIPLSLFLSTVNRDTIDHLRSLDPVRDKVEFKRRKEALPNVFFNGMTDGRGASDSNIVALNPFLFLDVDKVAPEDFASLKSRILCLLPSVLMMWRSCSGRGLGILIRTEGITRENWSSLRDHFAQYDLGKYEFDPKCFTLSRRTFLSHDDEAFFNWEAPALDLSYLNSSPSRSLSKEKTATKSNAPPLSPMDRDKGDNGKLLGIGLSGGLFQRLRFNNISDHFTGEHAKESTRHFPKGIAIVQVDKSYRRITDGNRNHYLFVNLVRILDLNPSLNESEMISFAYSVNARLLPSLDEGEVISTARKVFVKRYPATPNVLRKVLHNPKGKKTVKAKQSETQSIMRKKKGEDTQQRIYDFIEGYSGKKKLSGKMISEGTGIPIRTIERYGSQFREMIDTNHHEKSKEKERGNFDLRSPEDSISIGWGVYSSLDANASFYISDHRPTALCMNSNRLIQ